MYGNSKPGAEDSDTQKPGAAPCGTKMPAKRVGIAALCARAIGVSAGTIASRNGSAIVAPKPRRTVLLGSRFLVMYIALPSSVAPARGHRARGRRGQPLVIRRGLRAHPEHGARDDGLDQRGHPVIFRGAAAHDLAHGRHVVVLHAAAERVGHELLDEVGD